MNSFYDHNGNFHRRPYDVIVVGGGPAGSVAARYAAKNGAKTILFERDPVIGIPVRCGEGISERGIKGYVPLHGPWIANTLRQVVLLAPDGTSVKIQTKLIGYILNRDIFDKYLSDKAAESGAQIVTGADVIDLVHKNGKLSGVTVSYHGSEYEVCSKIIIGADGVESRVGRWAGINTMTKLNNMESAVQVRAACTDVDRNTCLLYFGRNVAPGGYAWVFPKNEQITNIGLAVSGKFAREKSPEQYLKDFLERFFPHAQYDRIVAGGVPCNPPLRKMAHGNVIVSGDAGHTVNPLTGAGIANALQSGKIAGEVAAEAASHPAKLESILQEYPKRWFRARGLHHRRFTRLKNFVLKMDDEKLNDLAHLMHNVPKSEWSLLKIFMFAVRNHPDLLIDAIKVFKKS